MLAGELLLTWIYHNLLNVRADKRLLTWTIYINIVQLLEVDFGAPLHSLVIAGELHPLELDMLNLLRPK